MVPVPPFPTPACVDLLCPVGEHERAQSFAEIDIRRGEGGNHHRRAISPQRLLEEAGELTVPVGDVLLALDKGRNDVSQRSQREVYLLSLYQPYPLRLSFALPLGTRQID